MHDYHAVKALVDHLTRDPVHAAAIVEVRVRASPLFSPEALQQAYEMLTADTPLSGSRLDVEDLPDRRECSRCGASFQLSREDVAGHLVICPQCGEPSLLEVGTSLEVIGITRVESQATAG